MIRLAPDPSRTSLASMTTPPALRRLALVVLLAAAPVALTGCVAVVAAGGAAGTVAWMRGALETNVEGSAERVATAAQRAVADLGFASVSQTTDATGGEIVARTAKDERIRIELTRITDSSTKVSIRVGTFGDQAISQQVLDAIKRRL